MRPFALWAKLKRRSMLLSGPRETGTRKTWFSAADKVAISLCLAAVAYCICGATFKLHRVSIDIAALPRADPAESDILGTGFTLNQVPKNTFLPPFRGSVKMYGSWATPLPSAGSAQTVWYKAAPHFAIFIAGFPNQQKNRLFIEVETAKAGIIRLPIPPELIPGTCGEWWLKSFSIAEQVNPLKLRVVAVGAPHDPQGWLGFSQPFVIRSVDNLELCKQLLWVLLATAAAIVAFLSPGLILRRRRRNLHFIWIPLLGIAPLALVALLAWIGPGALSPRIVCRAGLFLLIGLATYNFVRFPLSLYTAVIERKTLLVFLLLILIATGKTVYSLGPSGELFAGRFSRTYEVGAKSDSRFPYHVVQLVRFREPPGGDFATKLYAPWGFSDRGPLAGLAVTPIVLSPRVNLLYWYPDQAWSVFDVEGFAAYRAGMVVLACCALLTVFGLARLFLRPDWAFLAFLIAATAPFSVHEIFYTWPKLPEAGCVLIAAYLAFRRRYLFAGLALGFAYLVHPAALLSVPALIGIAILRAPKKPQRHAWMDAWIDGVFALGFGIGIWLVLWRLINEGHYSQDIFLSYFKMTGGLKPPTAANWLRSRVESVLDTLVPLYLFMFERWNLEVQSIYAFSPTVVRFFFAYWNTLPFGAGIAFFLVALLRLLYLAFVKARAWFIALIVIPFALLVPYWGWGRSGLMREGLHAWFLGLIVLAVVIWYRFLRRSSLFFRLCNWALLFTGIETLCMLLLPTIGSQHLLVQQPYVLSDTIALATVVAATAALYLYVFCFAERLRRQTLSAP